MSSTASKSDLQLIFRLIVTPQLDDRRQRHQAARADGPLFLLRPEEVAADLALVGGPLADRAVRVQADRFISRLPEGYQSIVRERGAGFSVGEKQLLSFARALAFDPPVLILDEATSSIDSRRAVMEMMWKRLPGGPGASPGPPAGFPATLLARVRLLQSSPGEYPGQVQLVLGRRPQVARRLQPVGRVLRGILE